MNVEIIRANINDVSILDKIENSLNLRILSKKSILIDLNNSNCYYYIAKIKNECVGYIASTLMVDHFDILSIATIEKYRKKGIGTKLLKTLLDKASELNVKDIFLEVRVSNKTAIRFYENNGFEKISIRKLYYANPTEDAYIYKKELVN